jgi:hypothetical protein
MTYRRSDDEGIFSSRWRISHRSELIECGIPFDVANDDRRWTYVLLHGDDLATGWKHTWLTEQQTTKLLALLQPYFPEPVGEGLVKALRRHSLK